MKTPNYHFEDGTTRS